MVQDPYHLIQVEDSSTTTSPIALSVYYFRIFMFKLFLLVIKLVLMQRHSEDDFISRNSQVVLVSYTIYTTKSYLSIVQLFQQR